MTGATPDHALLTVRREYLVRRVQTYTVPAPEGFDMGTYDDDFSFDEHVLSDGTLVSETTETVDDWDLVTYVVGDPRYAHKE